MAMAVGVKKLALFHHDPKRSDDQVDEILAMAQQRVKIAGGTLEVVAAAQDTTHILEGNGGIATRRPASRTKPGVLKERPRRSSALTTVAPLANQGVVVTYKDQEKFSDVEADGLNISYLKKGQPFLRSVNETKPSLILVSYESTGDEYVFKNCMRLRENFGEWGKDVPYIVIVKDQDSLEEMKGEHGDGAGITDFIVEPFSPAYIRTRIRMTLSRNPCKWVPPEKPKNEAKRIEALRSYQVLDSTPEERFDRITRMCTTVFDVPLVFISLVDENRQWFKSKQWLCSPAGAPTPNETSREVSFCGHAILQSDVLVIPDATQDDRFADNPLVTDGPKIRFYAGCPISVPNANDPSGGEHNIGTLCIIDQRPRDLDDIQKQLLREFAAMVKTELLNMAESMKGSKRSLRLTEAGSLDSLVATSQQAIRAHSRAH